MKGKNVEGKEKKELEGRAMKKERIGKMKKGKERRRGKERNRKWKEGESE